MSEDPSAPQRKNFHGFWLFFPWLTVGSLIFAEAIGFRSWLFSHLPSELSNPAQENIGWGLFLVTFGSSARWIYLRVTREHRNSFSTWVTTCVFAGLVTLGHACVATGLLFAGCLVIMWSR